MVTLQGLSALWESGEVYESAAPSITEIKSFLTWLP